VNTGPMEFLNQCRLERAAQQLRSRPELSITEIAFANGFNSSQYFATCFRRRFRVSPSHFLENAPVRQSQSTRVPLPEMETH
jgi:AraC-like DNA-binding protein